MRHWRASEPMCSSNCSTEWNKRTSHAQGSLRKGACSYHAVPCLVSRPFFSSIFSELDLYETLVSSFVFFLRYFFLSPPSLGCGPLPSV